MSIPAFAILGHPNEGKSSVVSTLTEDETVIISPLPGATKTCRTHSISIGGKSRLQLIDTPGFQNPSAVLEAFQAHTGPEAEMVRTFIKTHADQPRFHHDCELLKPLAERAGILYVADASRPLRESDRQEMEILRLTGLPRMALLNCKRQDTRHLDTWKDAIGRRFNIQRDFNAHHATYRERLQLLEALKILNQEWEAPLSEVIDGLKTEHERRIDESLLILESLLIDAARHVTAIPLKPGDDERALTQTACDTYQNELRALEARARKQWRKLHHLSQLPGGGEASLITDDLFAERVWKLLGLTRRQLATIGAITGGLIGLGADAATGGISFGIFTAGATALGAYSGWFGGPKLGAKRLPLPGNHTLAREQLQVGPTQNIALLSILIDRSLLYLLRLMNWSHARRDHEAFLQSLNHQQSGFVATWPETHRKALQTALLPTRNAPAPLTLPPALHTRLRQTLTQKTQ